MATTEEYAVFSAHVYGGTDAPALPGDWETFSVSPPTDSGFYAEAYRNTSTGEVVIAFRGTTDGGDMRADIGIAMQQATAQFDEALRFANDVISSNPAATVSTTGHSLGGALAQYVSGRREISGETFNAPGIQGMSGLQPMPGNSVTNWVVPTDVVGNFGDHVGSTQYIPSLPNPFMSMQFATWGPHGMFIGIVYYLYRSHAMETVRTYFRSSYSVCPSSPVILDLDGDGVETTVVGTGAYFDHAGDGFAEQTGWAGSDDGLLVFDRDGSGTIDSGLELFGSETLLASGSKAANGFAALAELDGNGDGKIDAGDAAWSALKVWQDADGDGYSSAGELHTLEELGVQSISTGYSNSTTVDADGNEHRQVGSFTRTDGTTAAAEDVWFQTDRMYSIAGEWVEVPADIAALPNLMGYGNVYDLHQAMARERQGATGKGRWRYKAGNRVGRSVARKTVPRQMDRRLLQTM